MTRANYFKKLFGGFTGDKGHLKNQLTRELYTGVLKNAEALDPTDPPDTPTPFGVYRSSGSGTVNGGALTLAAGDYVFYDSNVSKYVFMTTKIADS